MTTFNKIRIPMMVILLAQYPLLHFQVVTKFVGGMVAATCFDIFILLLTCESIKDNEISIGGSSVFRHKNPKTYWINLVVFIVLDVIFTAAIVFRLIKGPTA